MTSHLQVSCSTDWANLATWKGTQNIIKSQCERKGRRRNKLRNKHFFILTCFIFSFLNALVVIAIFCHDFPRDSPSSLKWPLQSLYLMIKSVFVSESKSFICYPLCILYLWWFPTTTVREISCNYKSSKRMWKKLLHTNT